MSRPWAISIFAGLSLLGVGCANDTVATSVLYGTAVVTYRDTGVSFGSFSTYAIWTKVGVVSDVDGVVSYAFEPSPEVIASIEANMAARGFVLTVRVDPENPPVIPPDSDLFVTPLAMQVTNTQFFPCDFWPWWGLPAFDCTFPWDWQSYRTGTLLILTTEGRSALEEPASVPVLWVAAGFAVLTPSASEDLSIAVGAVNQAFAQSPYLRTP